MTAERRKRVRVSFRTQVILTAGSDIFIDANSMDISMNGLYLETDTKVPLETPCNLKIIIKGQSNTLTMDMKGKIARLDDIGIGVEFDNDLEWWAIFAIYSEYGKSVRV
jgi:hypothetical protein